MLKVKERVVGFFHVKEKVSVLLVGGGGWSSGGSSLRISQPSNTSRWEEKGALLVRSQRAGKDSSSSLIVTIEMMEDCFPMIAVLGKSMWFDPMGSVNMLNIGGATQSLVFEKENSEAQDTLTSANILVWLVLSGDFVSRSKESSFLFTHIDCNITAWGE
ncbi:hypothetical protein VNO77_19881 [Canavalia gladiata]|uniref:Uncharacterized protein n=1 Tax=Canavalia gladiata TaxID=3824 RepID=A0AAN9LNM2_CANGL